MGFSLQNLLKGTESAVGGAFQDIQKGASHAAGALLPHSAPSTPAAPSKVTSLPNVWGTLVAQNTAAQQGYSPMFRNIVQGTNPVVDNLATHSGMRSAAGGEYDPVNNQIHLNSNQLDPYTVTHEGLHAAFQRKTPQAQAAFARVASKATPFQQDILNGTEQLGNPIYNGRTPLTEVHSFLPQYDIHGSSPTNQYYKNYFSNPDFYQENETVGALRNLLGPVRASQFSDRLDN